ncbi:MAG TPA: hypothetical protein DCM38_02605 [Gammaproteobacteria bacterium]|nr:hypothetical protein [Gammaproteobacteria bacterium]
MTGKKLIQKLTLQNFLSYSRAEIELQPLNVLIGPNGSGKSNLIEAFSLLKALPTNLLLPIRKGGGVNEFLWKGENKNPTAQIGIIKSFSRKAAKTLKIFGVLR